MSKGLSTVTLLVLVALMQFAATAMAQFSSNPPGDAAPQMTTPLVAVYVAFAAAACAMLLL